MMIMMIMIMNIIMINNNGLSNDINPFFLYFLFLFLFSLYIIIFLYLIQKTNILNIKTSFNTYKNYIFARACVYVYIKFRND